MNETLKKIILSGMFLSIYCLLFYFLLTAQLRLDFASFYSAAIAYKDGVNPYVTLVATYLPIPEKLPANLNPPFFLQLLSPLANLNFHLASSLWFIGSFILGTIGALVSFKISCSNDFFKKNWPVLFFIYLGMYATLMNAGIGQIGSILLFFIMTGYYFYLQKQNYLAGIFWGIIIAIKFFPALIFLFVLSQKRYKVLLIMLCTSIIAFLLPLLIKGISSYFLYFNMLPRVMWFGDNWNASLYGFLFRLFVDVKAHQDLWLIKKSYIFLFFIILLWYIKKIRWYGKNTHHVKTDHRAFGFTLVIMLLLSPLGWIYYFSLLIMPLTLVWQSLNQNPSNSNKNPALWAISLFFINFPLGYVEAATMGSIFPRLTVYSIYFYGLLIITYLTSRLPVSSALISSQDADNNKEYTTPLKITLALGVFITLGCFVIQLWSPN